MYLKREEKKKKNNTSIDSIQLLNERKRTKLSLVVFLVTLNFLNFCSAANITKKWSLFLFCINE